LAVLRVPANGCLLEAEDAEKADDRLWRQPPPGVGRLTRLEVRQEAHHWPAGEVHRLKPPRGLAAVGDNDRLRGQRCRALKGEKRVADVEEHRAEQRYVDRPERRQ